MSQLLAIILHLDVLLPQLLSTYGAAIYAILFTIITLETGLVFFPFLPGDSLLFATGALIASSSLSFWLMWVLLCVAAIFGDGLNYAIGLYFGKKLSASKLLNPKHLQRSKEYFEKNGQKAIILARFLPILRTFVPFIAGISHMPYRQFSQYNVVGGIAWVTSFLGSGYLFGQLPFVKSHFSGIILAIMIASIIPLVVDVARSFIWPKQKEQP